MKNKLLIIGAGGHGKVCADIALKMDRWKEIAFLDDDQTKKEVMGLKIIGALKDLIRFIEEYDIFIAIGDNETRQKLFKKIEQYDVDIPILIHPSAVISNQVEIGCGTVLVAGSIVNLNTKIGKGCIINTGATIDHDNIIEDFVHVSPGVKLAGNVRIGTKTWLGIGCTVINNINITNNCIIGAGSVIINNIDKQGVYVGTPAKKIK